MTILFYCLVAIAIPFLIVIWFNVFDSIHRPMWFIFGCRRLGWHDYKGNVYQDEDGYVASCSRCGQSLNRNK